MKLFLPILFLSFLATWQAPTVLGCAEQNPITEITLERTRCYGNCPAYRLVLRQDGTATYIGRANVERIGTYRGKIDEYTFDRLSDLLRSEGYFELRDHYSLTVTDLPSVITSALLIGKRKTVVNYGDTGPVKLWGMELAIDAVSEHIKWTK